MASDKKPIFLWIISIGGKYFGKYIRIFLIYNTHLIKQTRNDILSDYICFNTHTQHVIVK